VYFLLDFLARVWYNKEKLELKRCMKMNENKLNRTEKTALKKMQKLAKTIYTINRQITDLEVEKDNMRSNFHALLRCFPDARYVYYNG